MSCRATIDFSDTTHYREAGLMEPPILPPESLTNEAIASRLTTTAMENINKGLIKKKPYIFRVKRLLG